MSSAKLTTAAPQLPTGDINVSAAFFADRLGFEVVSRYPEHGHVILRRGAAEVHFWQAPSDQAAREIAYQSSCYVRVENLQALFEELQQRGAPFRYELKVQPWGMLEMQIDDPYGNAIRFGERVA